MLCPKCGNEMEEQEQLCPHCGQSLQPEEAPAPIEAEAETPEAVTEPEKITESEDTTQPPEDSLEETEAPEEDTAAQVPVETQPEDQPPKKKKSTLAILSGVIIVLLVVIVVALGVALKYVNDGNKLPSLSQVVDKLQEKKIDADAIAAYVRDEDGMDVAQINNELLNFYYWGEYYYFVNTYNFQFDSSQPLEDQVYEEVTDSESGETTVTTWQDYFMESAKASMNQIEAMKQAGQAEGFEMPEDYMTEYNNVIDTMTTNAASAGFVDDDGTGDALAYIQDSYGDCATMETFKAYLYDSYYASAYSDHIYYGLTYTTEDMENYFDEKADYFASYGVEKSDIPNVNVRHILIEPEADEDGNISDEAWEKAQEQAETLLEEWKTGEATEDSFGLLATENSADSGSSSNGGLYENVYPGEMVTAFNDWCFDPDRKEGDTDIVKTDYGYHIMYFVGHTEEYYYLTVAESDMRYYDGNAKLEELVDAYTVIYTDDADITYPSAVKTIMSQSASTTTEAAG